LARLEALAAERDVPSHQLILLGFSQGAIMTLAAVAGGFRVERAIAVAGRLAAPVRQPATPVSVLLVHDQGDPVMPVSLSAEASAALTQGGHRVEAVTTNGLGHRIGAATISAILDWMK